MSASVPAYVKGAKSVNTFKFKIINLSNKDTTISKNNASVNGSNLESLTLHEVTNDDLKQFILDNKLISNLPPDIIAGNIKINDEDIINRDYVNGVITFNISLNKYYFNGQEVNSSNFKYFSTITLTGFSQLKKTITKNFNDGKSIFSGSTNVDSVSDLQINNWFNDNINQIIIDAPSDFGASIVKIERISSKGEIKVTFTLTNYFDSTGSLQNDGSFTITISGFDIELFPWWIWVIVGLTAFIIIFVIVLIIVLVKRKKKAKKKLSKIPAKPPIPNNRLGLQSNPQNPKLPNPNNKIPPKPNMVPGNAQKPPVPSKPGQPLPPNRPPTPMRPQSPISQKPTPPPIKINNGPASYAPKIKK